MPEWLQVLLGVLIGVLVLWGALIVALWVQQRRLGLDLDRHEIARLAPDVIRLIRRLASDPSVPRAVRWWLAGLIVYLISPIDLVPDVIPVLGQADDAIVVAVVLRFALRHAGREALDRHWPGSEAGLRSVLVLTGLDRAQPGESGGSGGSSS